MPKPALNYGQLLARRLRIAAEQLAVARSAEASAYWHRLWLMALAQSYHD